MPRRKKNRTKQVWEQAVTNGCPVVFGGWHLPHGNNVHYPVIAPHDMPNHSMQHTDNVPTITPQIMKDLTFAHTPFNMMSCGSGLGSLSHLPAAHPGESANVARYGDNDVAPTYVSKNENIPINLQTVVKRKKSTVAKRKKKTLIGNCKKCSGTGVVNELPDKKITEECVPKVEILSNKNQETVGLNTATSDNILQNSVQSVKEVSNRSAGIGNATGIASETSTNKEAMCCTVAETVNSKNNNSDFQTKADKLIQQTSQNENASLNTPEKEGCLSEKPKTDENQSNEIRPSASLEDFQSLLDFPDELFNQSQSGSSMDLESESEESEEDVQHPTCSSPLEGLETLSKLRKIDVDPVYDSSGTSMFHSNFTIEEKKSDDQLSSASTVIIDRSFCEKHHTLAVSECHEVLYSLQLADGRTLRLISSVPKSHCPRQISFKNSSVSIT